MTKEELVDRMAKEAEISKTKANTALKALFEGVTGALKKGKRVSFVGFGTFSVGKRKARIGRNPQTGATIKIAASRVAKFRAGKALKAAVR
ncbi:MAG: DNA-binding protein HU [candidate division Zixibacteria bacterium RBG_16_40_9]|nr:MAG: DNA-binding protein HU [candidate division Zixibacteria bacterium RBG_16_40_9]